MSQKFNNCGRERVAQVPDVHFHMGNLRPKSAFFCPKNALETVESGQM